MFRAKECRLGIITEDRKTAYAASAVLFFTGNQKEAFKCAKQHLSKFKNFAAYLHFTARPERTVAANYAEHSRIADAQRSIVAALKLELGNPDILASKARLLEETGKYHEAYVVYDEVGMLAPNHPISYARRSILHRILGQHHCVLGELDKAVKAQSDYVIARQYRGPIRLAQGDAVGTLEGFDVVLQSLPHDTRMLPYRSNAMLKRFG